MPRRIIAVSGKRSVFRSADIFVSRNRCGFRFGTGIGQQPARKSAGETPGNISAAGSTRHWNAGCTLRSFFRLSSSLVRFVLHDGLRRNRRHRFVAVFRKRFTGKKNAFLSSVKIFSSSRAVGGSGRSGIPRIIRTPVIESTLPRPARLESAWLPPAILIATRIVAASFSALRSCILRRRQIASATRTTLWTSTAALSSAAPAPASAASAITTAVSASIPTAIAAPICASAVILTRAFASAVGARRVVLRGVVVRRKILRRRSVRIRLALVGGVNILVCARWFAVVMFFVRLTFGGVCLLMRSVFICGAFHVAGILTMCIFVLSLVGAMSAATRFAGPRQRFSRQNIDGCVRRFLCVIQRVSYRHLHVRRASWRTGRRGVLLLVPVVVVFQIFENVADVEESIAIQADVHESGLHAGKDAGDFAFVDAADERELFFALDVDFD